MSFLTTIKDLFPWPGILICCIVGVIAISLICCCLCQDQNDFDHKRFNDEDDLKEVKIEKSEKKSLKVKTLEKITVPHILLRKHFLDAPISEMKAKLFSEQRFYAQWLFVRINTVFEKKDNWLWKCRVMRGCTYFQEDTILHISMEKLNTYECTRYKNVTEYRGKWYAIFGDSSMNYHFKPESLNINEVEFFH